MILLTIGCANSNILTPVVTSNSSGDDAGRYLWAYGEIFIDPDTLEYQVIPGRNPSGHWNVLSWLENGPCTDCFKLAGITPAGIGIYDVDVEITHPFPNANFTGFDVRGVAMFEGSYVFPVSGLSISDGENGEGEIIHPDGYTQLYNITTAGGGPGGLQGYSKGKLATLIPPSTTLNAFKRFITDDPGNVRNCFYAGDEITVTYKVHFPEGQFIMGYAVDANWVQPSVKPVTDPISQFPPDANCPEPWMIDAYADPPGGELSELGGSMNLLIDVYDRQGKDSHVAPIVECPAIFNGCLEATYVSSGPGFSTWETTFDNDNMVGVGDYRLLVSVEDNENATSPYHLDLTSYSMFIVHVGEPQDPVAIPAADPQKLHQPVQFSDDGSYDPDGGTIDEYAWDFDGDLIPDETGNSVSHAFSTPGVKDVRLRVQDSQGAYGWSDNMEIEILNSGWVRTTGSDSDGAGRGTSVAVDSNSNIYVCGYAHGMQWDFDPGEEDLLHPTYGQHICFIECFSPQGNLEWWGVWATATSDCLVHDICVDNNGGVYVTGSFKGTVEFNPTGVSAELTAAGDKDAYLMKYSTGGEFQWVKKWGAMGNDSGTCVSANEGYVATCGSYCNTVDFDPSAGIALRDSNGYDDAFVNIFSNSGWHHRVMVWGGPEGDLPSGVEIDEAGLIHVTGYFQDVADFDPSLGTDYLDADNEPGGYDAFVTKLNIDGSYYWAKNWGDGTFHSGEDVRTDENDNVYVGGWFRGATDFDPGPGEFWRDSDCKDAFLSKFDTNGDFQWANIWGGSGCNYVYAMDISDSGYIDVVGHFVDEMDFDPTTGVDVRNSKGDQDCFLTRYDLEGNWQWANTWGSTTADYPYGVGMQSNGNTYVTGKFSGTVEWDPGFETWETPLIGVQDFFLLKYFNDGSW